MLLQTLVQLNILILATPALAGWSLLPLAQPGVVRSACVTLQCRTAETVAPKETAAQVRHAVRPQPAVLPRFTASVTEKPVNEVSAFFGVSSPAVASFNPFPHATRAP